MCRVSPAHFICFCSEVQVCATCISLHLLQQPSLSHKPVPVISDDLVVASENVKNAKKDRSFSTRSAIEREMQRLQDFKTEVLFQLQRIKLHYETEIAKTIEDLSESIHEETCKLQRILESCLVQENSAAQQALSVSQALEAGQELLTLKLDFRPVNVTGMLRTSLNFSLNWCENQANTAVIYKFFGGTNAVVCFDAEREVCTRQVTVSHRLCHNSCWCMVPSGEVMITGGSLTGHSRQSVFTFHPVTAALQSLPCMLTARRSHASVFYNGSCYVFGGILDDQRLSLCERYDWAEGKWAALPQMNERRAYLGACVSGSMIVLCGGGDTSSCEIFCPVELTFRLLSVPQINLLEVASVFAASDSIIIFHGNYIGEVSRLFLLTGEVVWERTLCYGNSWSCCTPIKTRDTLYFLRSDTVFKYNLVTGANSYLLRLGKAGKNCFE